MQKMRTSQIRAHFTADVESVWNVVTNNEDYAWRSDLQRIEIIDEQHFIEYSVNGPATEFFITKKDLNKEYAFEMKNEMFTGTWNGLFTPSVDGGCEIRFSESLQVKHIVIWLLSFLFWDLQKIQKTYIADLKRKVEENS